MVQIRASLDTALQRLWSAIEARPTGMLSLERSGLHAQPMIAFAERRRNRLWFVARRDNELVAGVGDGCACAFLVQDGELMASISGALHREEDRRRLARCWTPALAAWLPEGPLDPGLVLMRMDCVDVEVWIAGAGLTKFSFELAWPGARPALTQMQDVSGRGHATLH